MKTVIEKVFDFAIGARPGDRFTISDVADRLSLDRKSVSGAVDKLAQSDVFRKVGEAHTGSRPAAVYEVTGKLPDLEFRSRRRRCDDPLPSVEPAKLTSKTLTESELDALSIALLDRIPEKALKAELERRKYRPNGDLPPRVATLLGVAQ